MEQNNTRPFIVSFSIVTMIMKFILTWEVQCCVEIVKRSFSWCLPRVSSREFKLANVLYMIISIGFLFSCLGSSKCERLLTRGNNFLFVWCARTKSVYHGSYASENAKRFTEFSRPIIRVYCPHSICTNVNSVDRG